MSELRKLVAEELGRTVDPRVGGVARAIAAKHGAASRAILFYGSCLRQGQLEGLMLDFYLIVSDYRSAYRARWLALANRLVPPNVFYFEKDGLAAKYAVLSAHDFAHECSPCAWTVSTAARFAQPSRLVWSADAQSAEQAIDAVSGAAPTLFGWTLPLQETSAIDELWNRAFSLTFDAELRAERLSRPAALVDADPRRFDKFGRAALQEIARNAGGKSRDGQATRQQNSRAGRWWRRKQRHGKLVSIARLTKASFTFAGGGDYIAWKINRHAGTDIRLTKWQQRHPLFAAIMLLPRLIRTGAIR